MRPVNQSSTTTNQDLKPAIRHTTIESLSIDKAPGLSQNGIIYSFVASRKRYLLIKRAFDLFFSVMVITCVMSWLTPLLAILIKLDSRGPVFFRQKRIGKNGAAFYCLKFRTMKLNEEADERPASVNDERITRVGKFLRITNIDELPQFFNIIIGDMSVVGPRPHMINDCIRFSFVISSYSFRNLVRPGITGWAQVNGYHGPTTDYDSIINRYYWDAMYVGNLTILLDIKIIFKTIGRSMGHVAKMIFQSPAKRGEL